MLTFLVLAYTKFAIWRTQVTKKVHIIDGVEYVKVIWTTHCSGCTELGDSHQDAHLYPYDVKARCYVGSGCDECGYTGKRRCVELIPKKYDYTVSA